MGQIVRDPVDPQRCRAGVVVGPAALIARAVAEERIFTREDREHRLGLGSARGLAARAPGGGSPAPARAGALMRRPSGLPAQDLAAEVEGALSRLEAERETEIYGVEAVQLAHEYLQAALQHGPVTITFDNPKLGISTPNAIHLVDEQGRSHYAGRHSIATLARMSACLQQARPKDIPELELTLEQELKRQRALALQRGRDCGRGYGD